MTLKKIPILDAVRSLKIDWGHIFMETIFHVSPMGDTLLKYLTVTSLHQ